MHILSMVWGILALCGLAVGFFPCLGALNWINIPFAVVGLVVSFIANSKAAAENKGMALAGIVMSAIAVVVGSMRLIAGGGIF
jgi:hypothetical protein